MRRTYFGTISRRVAGAALMMAVLWTLPSAWAGGAVTVVEPWVREAPPNMRIHAGYAELKNQSAAPIDLISAKSPDYKAVELHLSRLEHGVATMAKQEQITIPARGMMKMAPGGSHLMLMHPKRALKAGETVEITLGFADGRRLTFHAPVKTPGDLSGGQKPGSHRMLHQGH